MPDIKDISEVGLESDLRASLVDIEVCHLALLHDIHSYKGKSVKDRLEGNQRIVEIIRSELARRQCSKCKGSGNCQKCGGSGKVGNTECQACDGMGDCPSCYGGGDEYQEQGVNEHGG